MRSQAAGYSLIEIMVAAALVAVLAGVAVPMVAAGVERYTLISASQQVASTIRAARFQAVGRNRVNYVRFDYPASGQYQIREMVGGVEVDGGDVQNLPNGVSFGDGAVDVQITAAGRVTTGSTIVVSNGDAAQDRTITVSQSGRVVLE